VTPITALLVHTIETCISADMRRIATVRLREAAEAVKFATIILLLALLRKRNSF